MCVWNGGFILNMWSLEGILAQLCHGVWTTCISRCNGWLCNIEWSVIHHCTLKVPSWKYKLSCKYSCDSREKEYLLLRQHHGLHHWDQSICPTSVDIELDWLLWVVCPNSTVQQLLLSPFLVTRTWVAYEQVEGGLSVACFIWFSTCRVDSFVRL